MIRRDILRDGSLAAWLLIRQTEHARLAARLAAAWRFWPEDSRTDLRTHLLETVAHHDDGWDVWDDDPAVRPADGAPLDFLEMPLDSALKIWTDSVDGAQRLGLLGEIVAGHFLFLLGKSSVAGDPRAVQWTADMEQRRADLLSQWQAESPSVNTREIAAEALQWLQLWDALSLWFCCSDARSEYTVLLPDQTTVRFQPTDRGIRVDPWVFQESVLDVISPAVECPARRSPSAATLIADHGRPLELCWQLSDK